MVLRSFEICGCERGTTLGLGLSACGSKLRVRVLCVAILGSDVGQNGSENVGDHKLVSDLGKNRSENSPTRLKTGRRFSVSDLSPTVNAQPATLMTTID